MHQPMEEFHPQDMVVYGKQRADEAIREMTSEDAVAYVRQYIFSLESEGFISPIDKDSDGAASTAAIQALAASALFQRAFIKAYTFAENHLNNIESLKRQFDL